MPRLSVVRGCHSIHSAGASSAACCQSLQVRDRYQFCRASTIPRFGLLASRRIVFVVWYLSHSSARRLPRTHLLFLGTALEMRFGCD